MNFYTLQLSLDFDDLYTAANEHNLTRGEIFSLGSVRRNFPSGKAGLVPGEVKRIMAEEMKDCRKLNSLYSNVFKEVIARCPDVGIDYLGFRLVSTDAIPADDISITLEMALKSQYGFPPESNMPIHPVCEVRDAFISAVGEVNKTYNKIEKKIEKQIAKNEEHPVNIIARGEAFSENEDRVEIGSRLLADYVDRSLREHKVLSSSLLCIGDIELSVAPSKFLTEAMAEDPCPERESYEAFDVYVWTAYEAPNGEVYVKVDGCSVGRRAETIDVQIHKSCFTNKMLNDAKRVNVNYLYQYPGKIVDMEYIRCKPRVTRPHLMSKHEIVCCFGNHRKLHQITGRNRVLPDGSLDRLVRERSALI